MPGIGDIPAQLIKSGGPWTMKPVHNLILPIWNHERIPQKWSKIVICPTHKKGDELISNNYTGTGLSTYDRELSMAKKVLD